MTDQKTMTEMPLNEATVRKVQNFRTELLRLHKILLDDEKQRYEKEVGPVAGASHLLSLVMSDSFFDWLHRISELVVIIDETLEDDKSTLETAENLLESGRTLFRASASEDDTEFMKNYKTVLRRSPAAVMAHSEVQRALLSDA